MSKPKKIGPTALMLAETIQRLNEEWEYFKQTGRCLKCAAQILGMTQVYDLEHRGSKIFQCRQCAKIIQENGGRHLEKVRVMPISEKIIDETADYLFEKIPKLGPRSRSRRKPPVFVDCS